MAKLDRTQLERHLGQERLNDRGPAAEYDRVVQKWTESLKRILAPALAQSEIEEFNQQNYQNSQKEDFKLRQQNTERQHPVQDAPSKYTRHA